MEHVVIRRAELKDIPVVADLFNHLWPETSVAEHTKEVALLLAGNIPGPFAHAVFVAEEVGAGVVGFIEVDLRSHADGCDPARPVGYIEGWYVAPPCRRSRVGAKLVAAAEEWARYQGCKEMASDAWLHAVDSQRAHEALGYEVVDRCVHYRKDL